MAENREIDLNEILNRLEFLEKENVSLREEVTELKNNDIEFRNEINVSCNSHGEHDFITCP